jgi:ABC-type Mn2+/Zn2+ transport system ATPase subunit
MLFKIDIKQVRPIASLAFEIDLSRHGIRCIVGKNGAGKTTLAKAIMNLAQANTFLKTSSENIFNSASTICYTLGEDQYQFTYDPQSRSVSTKIPVQADHKSIVSVEMPAPYGQRFTFFQTLTKQDADIRQAVVLERYEKPTELIKFLSNIYQDSRFDTLVEVQFQQGVCCCLIDEDKRYIREDYFSSGEYFLINLYRKVTQGISLVVIDEIDISLDASTQARLAEQLRQLCVLHKSTVVFTSHSLALMQTLGPDELHYLERDEATGVATLLPMSFNGVKSLMFGFQGFDRYILTEDRVLEEFLEYVINRYCSPTFYSYQIICVNGQGQAKGLMKRNVKYKFLGSQEDVMCFLDGDQADKPQPAQVHCIPLHNVEDALWHEYRKPGFQYQFPDGETLTGKLLYKKYTSSNKLLSSKEIFQLLCDHHDTDMKKFAQTLSGFLCRPRA